MRIMMEVRMPVEAGNRAVKGGTLYGAISRLEAGGLIEPLAPQDRRNPYRLTVAGERSLRDRLASLAVLAAAGTRRLATT